MLYTVIYKKIGVYLGQDSAHRRTCGTAIIRHRARKMSGDGRLEPETFRFLGDCSINHWVTQINPDPHKLRYSPAHMLFNEYAKIYRERNKKKVWKYGIVSTTEREKTTMTLPL